MKAPDLARSTPPQPLEDKAKHYEQKAELTPIARQVRPDLELSSPSEMPLQAQFRARLFVPRPSPIRL